MHDKIQFIALVIIGRLAAKRDERGATATEYGILVGFLAFAIIAGVTVLGGALDAWYSDLAPVVAAWATP